MIETNDAVTILLERRAEHRTARLTRDVLRANPTFFAVLVGRLFWLHKRKRACSAESLFQFLRGRRWNVIGKFMLNDKTIALVSRIALLLYPALNNGMMRPRDCEADRILGTWVESGSRGKKNIALLRASEATQAELIALPPVPEPIVPNERSKRHITVTPEEAAFVLPLIEALVAGAPNPQDELLKWLLDHARTQPEVFALAQRRFKKRATARRREHFSISSDLTHAQDTVQTKEKKYCTLPRPLDPLYCRAAERHNPRLNGFAQFKADSTGPRLTGRANALLGCRIAETKVNGEPHRRLLWLRDGVGQ
ncbi:MAG: hypothetical protein ABSB87_13270 [Terriglobales bacterium]|jgi:hypothetical protein